MGFNIKLVTYIGAGTITGLLAGASLGWVGSMLAPDARAALATAVAILGVCIGLLQLAGWRVRPLQFDRETPYGWLAPGPLRWAVRNGAAIGLGAFTRVGFWLWYVVPLGALLSASPLLGAVGYGVYAIVRTGGAGGIRFLERTDPSAALKILRLGDRAQRVASAQLVLVAVVAILVVGV